MGMVEGYLFKQYFRIGPNLLPTHPHYSDDLQFATFEIYFLLVSDFVEWTCTRHIDIIISFTISAFNPEKIQQI